MKELLCVLAAIFLSSTLQAQFTCTKGTCYEGHGAGTYANGNRYEGQFEQGQPHGLGILWFANGDQYIGDWKRHIREGKGRFRFANGNEYFGEFKRNKMHGKGRMTYQTGAVYDGYWVNNYPQGEGKLILINGDRYEGNFGMGKFHGFGIMYYQAGGRYEGQWYKGEQHGEGLLVSADGTTRQGHWEHGQYAGKDLASRMPPVEDTGLDTNFLRNCNLEFCSAGKGEFSYANGARYVGQFLDGVPYGKGKMYYPNGDRYEGDMLEHEPHGRGTMFYLTGQTLQAVWEHGRPKEILSNINSQKQPEPGDKKPDAKDATPSNIKVYAVVVGVAQYTNLQSLKYTDDDAYQLYAFLKSPQGGAIPDQQLQLLIDEDASKTRVLDAMQRLFLNVKSDDVIIFYFSGHGIKGAFLPVDYDGYRNELHHQEIQDIINRSPARHKIIIADACHAGDLGQRRSLVSNMIKNYYAAFEASAGGSALLLSSKGEEYSLEDSGLRSGVYSHFLIKGLKGAADLNDDGIISVMELHRYVYRNVRIYTGNIQTPLLLGEFDNSMPIGVVR